MPEIIRPLLEIGSPEVQRPYFPFLEAVQRRIIDLGSVAVEHFSTPIGVLMGNGIVPSHKNGGIVELIEGEDEVLAVDHVRVTDAVKGGLVIGPSAKADVEKLTGKVCDAGLITLSSTKGLVKIIAMVIGAERAEWLEDQASVAYTTGKLAVVQFGPDSLEYEVVGRSEKVGSLTIKERKRHR